MVEHNTEDGVWGNKPGGKKEETLVFCAGNVKCDSSTDEEKAKCINCLPIQEHSLM